MKIVELEAIPFTIPYRKPLRFASGEVHVADHVLVRVHTDDGVVGAAEAPPRPYTYGETQESIVAVVEKLFAPALTGLTLLEREVAHARMERTVGNPAAKAAVDMAIWDALGRTLGFPVTQLLGGFTDRGARVAHAHRSSSRRAGELSNFLDMSDDLLTEPLTIAGGELAVPPGPGTGIDIDPEKLTRYRTDR